MSKLKVRKVIWAVIGPARTWPKVWPRPLSFSLYIPEESICEWAYVHVRVYKNAHMWAHTSLYMFRCSYVWVCMCAWLFTCVHGWTLLSVRGYAVSIYDCIWACVCIHISVSMHMYVCLPLRVYVRVCVFMCLWWRQEKGDNRWYDSKLVQL